MLKFEEQMVEEERINRCMVALSVRQPWADLIYIERKWFETRTWNAKLRGDFLLHASAKIENRILETFLDNGYFDPDRFGSYSDFCKWHDRKFQTGAAIAVVNLFDCRPMLRGHEIGACCEVYPRAHAFYLRNVRPIEPIQMKGKLNFFKTNILPEDLNFV